jgi:hypothetical protein
MRSGPRSEEQTALVRDLASITTREERQPPERERRPLVVGQPGFIVGTIIAFILICPLALAAMENLNPVTFVVVRPYVPVGLQGVLATGGAWLCLSVIAGIGTVCIMERRLRWSLLPVLLLLAVCVIVYAPAANAAATRACAEDHRNHVQVRC